MPTKHANKLRDSGKQLESFALVLMNCRPNVEGEDLNRTPPFGPNGHPTRIQKL